MFTTKSKISSGKILLAGAAVIALSMASAASYAGFQWVPPPGGQAPASPDASAQGADNAIMTPAPGAALPAEPVSAQPLNSSDSQSPAAPAAQTSDNAMHTLVVPAKDMPAMKPATPAPAPAQAMKTITVTPTPAQQLQAQANQAAAPAAPAPQASGNLPQASSNFTPMPVAASEAPAAAPAPQINWNPAPANNTADNKVILPPDAPKKAAQAIANEGAPETATSKDLPETMGGSASAPPPPGMEQQAAETQTKVIMPSDAPAKAVSATPNGQQPVINPLPAQETASTNEQGMHQTTEQMPEAAPSPAGAEPAASETMQAQASAPAPMEAPQGAFTKVQGFGSDMPLALALSQIAPASYTFSYGDDVNPGARVSWDGKDRPWNDVITSMIAPMNLQATIEGNIVHIGKTGEADAGTGGKQSMAQPIPQIQPEASQPPLKISQAQIHRSAIRDPGEKPGTQPASAIDDIAPASGDAAPVKLGDAAPPPAASAQPPSAPAANQASNQNDAAPAPSALPLPPGSKASASMAAPDSDAKPLLASAESAQTAAPANVFEAHEGDSLKQTLTAWSKQAGVTLTWNAAHDYTIDSNVAVNDSFEAAVKDVISEGLKNGDARPSISFQQASGKPADVIIADPKSADAGAASSGKQG